MHTDVEESQRLSNIKSKQQKNVYGLILLCLIKNKQNQAKLYIYIGPYLCKTAQRTVQKYRKVSPVIISGESSNDGGGDRVGVDYARLYFSLKTEMCDIFLEKFENIIEGLKSRPEQNRTSHRQQHPTRDLSTHTFCDVPVPVWESWTSCDSNSH